MLMYMYVLYAYIYYVSYVYICVSELNDKNDKRWEGRIKVKGLT